ncbi:hypothetical protein PSPO01_04667 [Paraphaeosphaeria sporulosa]
MKLRGTLREKPDKQWPSPPINAGRDPVNKSAPSPPPAANKNEG